MELNSDQVYLNLSTHENRLTAPNKWYSEWFSDMSKNMNI